MPELSALTRAGLPQVTYNPEPIIQAQSLAVPSTVAASGVLGQAAVMNAAADTISKLPSAVNTAYQTGQSNVINQKENQARLAGLNLKGQIMSGQGLSDTQKQALAGMTIGPDGSTSVAVPQPYDVQIKGAQLQDVKAQADLRTQQADKARVDASYGHVNPFIEASGSPAPTMGTIQPPTESHVTTYGNNGDPYGGPSANSTVIGMTGKPTTENSVALSPDWEAAARSAGLKPGDSIIVHTDKGDAQKVWDDVTAQDSDVLGGKIKGVTNPLRGRVDFRASSDGTPSPFNGSKVLGISPVGQASEQASPNGTPILNADGTPRTGINGGILTRFPGFDREDTTGATYDYPHFTRPGVPAVRVTNKQNFNGLEDQKLMQASKVKPNPGENVVDWRARASQAVSDAGNVDPLVRPAYDKFADGLANNPVMKDYLKVRTQYDSAKAALAGMVGTPNPAQAVALVDDFVKTMSGGAARMGTIKLLENAQPIQSKWELLKQKFMGGPNTNTIITPEMAQQMGSVMDEIKSAADKHVDTLESGFAARNNARWSPEATKRAFDPYRTSDASAMTGAIGSESGGAQAPAAPATPAAASKDTIINSQSEYDALPPGTPFLDSYGRPGMKPAQAAGSTAGAANG